MPDWNSASSSGCQRGMIFTVRLPSDRVDAPPSQAQLDEILHQTWWDWLKIEANLRRKTVFEARFIVDTRMKNRLLKLLQWEAASRGVDAWYNGRFIDQWASPDVLAALPALFPTYDAAAISRAARANMELTESVARQIASACGLRFPEDVAAKVRMQLGDDNSLPTN